MEVLDAPRITPEIVAEHGLAPDEYDRILKALEREPNLLELGIFSVMWSEHCSYKSSRVHLRKLPTEARTRNRGGMTGARHSFGLSSCLSSSANSLMSRK